MPRFEPQTFQTAAACSSISAVWSQFLISKFQVQDDLFGPFIFTRINIKKRLTMQSRCLIRLGLVPLNLAVLLIRIMFNRIRLSTDFIFKESLKLFHGLYNKNTQFSMHYGLHTDSNCIQLVAEGLSLRKGKVIPIIFCNFL